MSRWSYVVLVAGMLASIRAYGGVATTKPSIDAKAIDAYITAELKDQQYPSLSIGIVQDQALVLAKAYGVADRKTGRQATADSLYFIGSVTKVFTATLMCMLRDQGVLRLDDPISKYLPDSVKLPSDSRGAPAITLRHLATHSSGLPGLPPNLIPKGDNPYGGYTVGQLDEGLARVKLAYPTGAKYE